MSCLPNPTNSKNDLEKWTTNVTVMLNSPRARRKFNEFLCSRNLDEAEMTLQFWENCNRLLFEASHNSYLKKDDNSSKIQRMRFLQEVSSLLDFAEEHINFDVSQLREFREAVEKHDIPHILKTILRAQNSASSLMQTEYELFRKNLLKDSFTPIKSGKK